MYTYMYMYMYVPSLCIRTKNLKACTLHVHVPCTCTVHVHVTLRCCIMYTCREFGGTLPSSTA